MVQEQKRYGHCVIDFRQEIRGKAVIRRIRSKSGDLPVMLLQNTTTGYSQAMRFILIQGAFRL